MVEAGLLHQPTLLYLKQTLSVHTLNLVFKMNYYTTSDLVTKIQKPSEGRKWKRKREEQRMKEEKQNNADTYRFIDTSPPKKQLMAAIIHIGLKKNKKET